jgi:hypothetical protein
MPEIVGTEGTEGTGEGTGTEGTGAGTGTEGTTFTQSDVDRIVKERLARQKAQFGDYEDLKAKASQFDEIAESQKSELEKANERAAKAEAETQAVQERAARLLTDAALTAAAAGKLADPTDVALIDRGAIEYGDDGAPTNVAALVDSLIETKPHLAASTRKVVDIDGGARGGATSMDDAALMALPDDQFLKALGNQ